MTGSSQVSNLNEAASRFLAGLASGDAGISQQVIYQFVRWFGRQQPLDKITAGEIANYAQRISVSDTDYQKKLDIVRTFLTHAREAGWIKQNLAMHLKAKKGKPRLPAGARQNSAMAIPLTRQGYDAIQKGLLALKGQKPSVIDEIKRAAEDKDFRENAPLDAARERLSHLEGRIIELEETLKRATIIDDRPEVIHKVCNGDSIILVDLSSGEKLNYTVVSPKEVDPGKGKISNASPIGRAIIGREPGDIIEIEVPSGRLRYRVENVKH